ncbi:MAG: hypothetical protein M3Z56_03630 [Bacteroidota bacterium]|nr:hypothetical protein [Bacteroidota bacterium]
MENFEVILKNEKIKGYRFLAFLLVLANLAIFIFLLAYDSKRYEASASLLLTGIYVFIRLYLAKRNNHNTYFDEIIFFVLAGCWVGLGNYYLVVTCAIMGILYYMAMQKLKFIFNERAVQKLNFPKAQYSWDLFTNVMIKDKILTLDLKNNKLMQLEIENEEGINEFRFNQFAREQIDSQNALRKIDSQNPLHT